MDNSFWAVIIIIVAIILFILFVWLESLGAPEETKKPKGVEYLVRLSEYGIIFKITVHNSNNYTVIWESKGDIVYKKTFKIEHKALVFLSNITPKGENNYVNDFYIYEATGSLFGLPTHHYFLSGLTLDLDSRVELSDVLISTPDMNNTIDKILKLDMERKLFS